MHVNVHQIQLFSQSQTHRNRYARSANDLDRQLMCENRQSSSSEWQRRRLGTYYASQDIVWCLIYYYSWSGQAQDFASPHFSGG